MEAKANISEMNSKSDNVFLFNADEKLDAETFQKLQNLFQSVHIDNMMILRALICPKDDVLPLLEGATKRRVRLSKIHRCINYCIIYIYIYIYIYTHTQLLTRLRVLMCVFLSLLTTNLRF